MPQPSHDKPLPLLLVIATGCLTAIALDGAGSTASTAPTETLPPHATAVITRGDIHVNGHSRFLIAAFIPEGADRDSGIRTTGYPAERAWIYESLPDYQQAQTLGLDGFGITPEHDWRRIFRPRPLPRRNWAALNRPLKSGLPIIADLAIDVDSPGRMTFMDGVNPKEQAWFEGEAHGVPYSVISDEGLRLWSTIWRATAASFTERGVSPLAYRLFAGADYWDVDARTKTAFARHLGTQFGTVAAMNEATGEAYTSFHQASRFSTSTNDPVVHVLYTTFLETAWTNALVSAARAIASGTRTESPAVFFQPRARVNAGVDLFSAAAVQGLLCAPAEDDDPALTAVLLRAAAQHGQPLIICDIPVDGDATALRNTLLTQFARGYAIAAPGPWRRGASDWTRYQSVVPPGGGRPQTRLDPEATEQAGIRHAEQNPGWILNPHAVPPATLEGIRMARRDAHTVAHRMTAASRMTGTAVALLHTRSAERLRGTGRQAFPTNDLSACLSALHQAGYKAGALAEGHLSSVSNSPWRVVVVSDSAFATQPEHLADLSRFVESGGTLILTRQALTRNPYGNPLSDSPFDPPDDAVAHQDETGIRHDWSHGKGRVIRFKSAIPAHALPVLFETILTDAGVDQTWACVDPESGRPHADIEIAHALDPDGTHTLVLFNRGGRTVDARIRLPAVPQPQATDPVRKRALPVEGDAFQITLQPAHGEIVVVTPTQP